MEVDAILQRVQRREDIPEDWAIFPIVKEKLAKGIAGWVFGTLLGLGLFTLVAFAVIPANYQREMTIAFITTIFLGILLFVGLGSLYLLIVDALRLTQSENQIIIVTPEIFIKQSGKKVISVPIEDVSLVTARGNNPTAGNEAGADSDATPPRFGIFGGGGVGNRLKRRTRTPISLAFKDRRTDKTVTILNDAAFGDHYEIAEVLDRYAKASQGIVQEA